MRDYAKPYRVIPLGMLFVSAWFIEDTHLIGQEIDASNQEEEDPGPVYLEEGTENYFNWVEVGAGGVIVDGNDAQFMHRHQKVQGASGGIRDFHYEKFVGEGGLFRIDGRGLLEQHDYSVTLELEDTQKGYVQVGYEEYRTWYDASGGYFPLNDAWFPVFGDERHIDRGKAWIEAGLTRPDLPEVSIRYSYRFREGDKGSQAWGDTDQTGQPGIGGRRGIVPSLWDIDENRHIVEGEGVHTWGDTTAGVGLRYEFSEIDNERHIRREPGEAEDRHVAHREGIETDLFNTHAFTQTELTDQLDFTTGYSFTTLDSDLSGNRVYGSDFDPVYDPTFRGQFEDEGFLGLSGGSQMDQHVVNLNLMYRPFPELKIVPSVRAEKRDLESFSNFRETNVGLLGRPPDEKFVDSEQDILDVSESLEATYTGIPDWVFYARGYWLQGDGGLEERKLDVSPGSTELFRDTDTDRFTQKYTAGVNWYILNGLTVSSQYYHKMRDYDYDHREDSAPNGSFDSYPAFIRDQGFDTDDVNFRIHWRPLNQVTLVSRYDFQFSTIDSRMSGLSEIESSKMTSHILSQSITWTPWTRLYLQGSINYVMDEVDTPANDVGGTAGNLALTAENDYWNGNVSVGYAIAARTDVEATYLYYRSDNYTDNSQFSQPYGAESEEHGVMVSLKRRVSEQLLWQLQYGFFDNNDTTYGGHNDYEAHLVASSIKYMF